MTTTRTAPKVRTAIAMMNMGGPSTLDEVPSFLKNLFSDPEIIPLGPFQEFVSSMVVKRRSPKIQAQYAAIGGGAPIGKWTNHQGNAMCKILDEIRPESAPHKHYTMFRYANPLTEAALTEMKNDGAERAIAFSQVQSCVLMYPGRHTHKTLHGTTVPAMVVHHDRLEHEPFVARTKAFGLGGFLSMVAHRSVRSTIFPSQYGRPYILNSCVCASIRWNTHPGYIAAVSRRIQLGLEAFPADVRDKVVIMFSAHSVPMKVVYKGDPYTKEIASTSERVMEHLSVTNPHHFKRSPSLNEEPLLAQAMADLVKDHLDSNTLHSPAYPLNCAGCENPTCRSIVNPIKPYARSRDVACGRPTSQSVHDLE
ncbi:hypothetical protein DYB30_003001 [Aphanomyces astaci]|uniref:Ferrochelatase n=1 Tax=Aphanomyces astaci TaxID=112090 RepID=A0A397DDJ9_APHAT|nr:hypothetical protein DYB30_003001 [Aphanomyces astaci]